MKLYANIKGDRGEKGKGSNDKLVVNILIDNKKRKEIGNLVLTCTTYPKDNNVFELTYYPINENCTEQKINSGKVVLYKTLKK